MNFLNNLIPENLVEAFGWMIIHSIWQGALVALLLSIVLLILNKRSARIRYIASVGALLFFVAISIRTFGEHYQISKTSEVNLASINEVKHSEELTTVPIVKENENDNILAQISRDYKTYFNTHLPLIVTIYILGVLFLTLKLTGGFIYSQRVKHYRTKEVDSKYKRLVTDLSERLKINQVVKLVESAMVKVPVTLGYFKPVILFPLGALTGMSTVQVETIIAHELAHIKRADYLINLFQSILEIIFFYHPAMWWISSIIREERENVCDDLALEVSNQPVELAKALVFVSSFENDNTSLAMSAIGNKNKLIRRVKRMMGENKNKSLKSRVYAASLLLLIIMAFGAAACSTANGEAYYQDKQNLVYEEKSDGDARYINTDRIDDDERTYIFYKRFHDDKSKWKVTVDDNRVVALFKNGDRVPSEEIYKYENMLLDEVENIDWDLKELHEELADLKDDLRDIKVDLDEDFAKDIRKLSDELKSEFNSEEFKREMKELKRDLRDIRKSDFHFEFSSEEFRKEMEELKEELSNINFDIDIDWDSDSFRKEMKDLSRELANIKVDIDLSGLDESMAELREELKHLDIDMSGLKKEMEILGDFLDELKVEMIADGVVDNEDDFRRLEFEDDALYVNNRKVPHELYLKYREIYKKYYDEYPDGNSFRIHDNDRW